MIDLPELMQQLATLEFRLHHMTQRAELLKKAVLLAKEVEDAWHAYPSFDRPVEGCRLCAAIAKALEETP